MVSASSSPGSSSTPPPGNSGSRSFLCFLKQLSSPHFFSLISSLAICDSLKQCQTLALSQNKHQTFFGDISLDIMDNASSSSPGTSWSVSMGAVCSAWVTVTPSRSSPTVPSLGRGLVSSPSPSEDWAASPCLPSHQALVSARPHTPRSQTMVTIRRGTMTRLRMTPLRFSRSWPWSRKR